MNHPQSDHDLLIQLHEQVKAVRDDISDLKNDTISRLKDLETRTTWLERIAYGGMAILGSIQWYLNYIK
jgi:hypothetical protein